MALKIFEQRQVNEALAYSYAGGQALHVHRIIPDRKTAPRCFVRAVDKGENIAHLFDLDSDRLKRTAESLGVRVIFIHREATPKQHIDLCGKPLKVAMSLGEKYESPER